MKGLTFVAIGEISPEAKEKLKKLLENRDKKLKKLKQEYQNKK